MTPYERGELEKAKLLAETEKLEAEKMQVQRSEWRKISSYSVLVPSLLLVFSLPLLIQYWNAKREILQRDIVKFEDARDSLLGRVTELSNTVAHLESTNGLLARIAHRRMMSDSNMLVTFMKDLNKATSSNALLLEYATNNAKLKIENARIARSVAERIVREMPHGGDTFMDPYTRGYVDAVFAEVKARILLNAVQSPPFSKEDEELQQRYKWEWQAKRDMMYYTRDAILRSRMSTNRPPQ
jgi:hypothetical protein